MAAPVVLSRAALRKSGGQLPRGRRQLGLRQRDHGPGGPCRRAARPTDRRELLSCRAGGSVCGFHGRHRRRPAGCEDPGGASEAIARLSRSGLDAASHAILTTDVGPKVAAATFRVGSRRGRIVGFAKGAGMIHPNMATMLAFVMTDAAASPAYLRLALKRAADESFNAISVDGDTSTNDTVLLMASGRLGGPPLSGSGDGASFEKALDASVASSHGRSFAMARGPRASWKLRSKARPPRKKRGLPPMRLPRRRSSKRRSPAAIRTGAGFWPPWDAAEPGCRRAGRRSGSVICDLYRRAPRRLSRARRGEGPVARARSDPGPSRRGRCKRHDSRERPGSRLRFAERRLPELAGVWPGFQSRFIFFNRATKRGWPRIESNRG